MRTVLLYFKLQDLADFYKLKSNFGRVAFELFNFVDYMSVMQT